MLEPAVDGFCGAVGSAWPVEVGEYVRCPAIEGPPQVPESARISRGFICVNRAELFEERGFPEDWQQRPPWSME